MAEADKWRDDGGEDDEEDEVDDTGYKNVKDAILFVIDVSPTMLKRPPPSQGKNADNDAATSAALKCAYQLMQQRIISHPNDKIGILLFGTEATKFDGQEEKGVGNLSYPHCYLLTDLDIPAAEDVKALKSIIEDEEESQKLLVPSKEPVSMANVLFCTNQIFTTRAPNFSSRRVFLVTDNDDPHASDKALKSSATVRAKDLYDLGVIIELFPIARFNQEFDRGKFYDDMIYRTSPTDLDAPAPVSISANASSGNGLTLLSSLLSSIRSKAVARRALFANLPLEIGPGFKISVKGYIVFKRQEPARSCYVWLNGERAQIAKGVSTQMAEDVARPVEKAEIKKAYKFGGEQITFTPDEMATVRHFGDPVIRIIGFKPTSMLPIWASLKPSTFIYPSEEDFVGSTRVFSALQQKLLKDDKMGIAWFIARKNAAPVIAAVIPGPERLGDNGEQTMPPGLWLVPLPFADDIRQDPDTSLVRAPDSLVDLMRKVVQQLQLPKAQYNPTKYSNPSLQWHYRILQAMALEEELPEKPEDTTIPKYRQIDKRAGPYVTEWGQELEHQFRAWQKENSTDAIPSKRSGAPLDAAMPKRPKPSSSSDVPTDGEMRLHYQQRTLNKLTMTTLKAFLATKSQSTSGKKADLLDRIEGWFETKA